MMGMANLARSDRRQKLRDKVSALLDDCEIDKITAWVDQQYPK